MNKAEVQTCIDYLSKQKILKSVNESGFIGYVKHDVEEWYEKVYSEHLYISREAVVMAALALNIPYKNECLGISKVRNEEFI